MKSVIVHIQGVNRWGVELRAYCDRKPDYCPSLGGWKLMKGYYCTYVKGRDAKLFSPLIGGLVNIIANDHGKIITVE